MAYRTFLEARNASIIPEYLNGADGVVFAISNSSTVGVCAHCGKTFRNDNVALGAVCPYCGRNNFVGIPSYSCVLNESKTVCYDIPGGKQLEKSVMTVRTVSDKKVVEFDSSIVESYSWDGKAFTFNHGKTTAVPRGYSSSREISEENISMLAGDDEAVKTAKSIYTNNGKVARWRGFDINDLNNVIDAIHRNPDLTTLATRYPAELYSVFEADKKQLMVVHSLEDICDVLGIPKDMIRFHKYLHSSEIVRLWSMSLSGVDVLRNLLKTEYGSVFERYIERDAFDGQTIAKIFQVLNNLNIYLGKPCAVKITRKDYDYENFLREVGEQQEDRWRHRPAAPAIPNETLELFYEFQAKNCLVYGACWKEFLERVRWLMANGYAVSTESLDSKNFHVLVNKSSIGKPKFHELVVNSPLEAINYI